MAMVVVTRRLRDCDKECNKSKDHLAPSVSFDE